jgi:hypothetical protein
MQPCRGATLDFSRAREKRGGRCQLRILGQETRTRVKVSKDSKFDDAISTPAVTIFQVYYYVN